jgi:dTDP-4-dehydrorhamnose reductase
MEQKILILGANGMLGHALAQAFSKQSPILWDLTDLDITNQLEVDEKISALMPEVIINAAAYTNVDGCEDNFDLANQINGVAIGYLARAAKKNNAVLIHYSTDYVFSGENQAGYKEDDQTNPLGAYGKSKLLGEYNLLKNTDKYYLIRTSWLFGEFGDKNFIKKILTKAEHERNLKVVNDHFGKPTYAPDLATRTRELIDHKESYGIYHVTNETVEGGISWYDLAKYALEVKKLDNDIVPCRASDFPQKAVRPKYSALINSKLKPMRDWREAVKDYLLK